MSGTSTRRHRTLLLWMDQMNAPVLSSTDPAVGTTYRLLDRRSRGMLPGSLIGFAPPIGPLWHESTILEIPSRGQEQGRHSLYPSVGHNVRRLPNLWMDLCPEGHHSGNTRMCGTYPATLCTGMLELRHLYSMEESDDLSANIRIA